MLKHYKQIPKKKFLENVKLRLQNDVGLYIGCIESDPRFVGFWGLARLIFPVIEAISTTIDPTSRDREAPRLLGLLGIKYPNLVWVMYRHSLSHTDEFRCVIYQGMRINWGINRGQGHKYRQEIIVVESQSITIGTINIDIKKLYLDLNSFLDEEIGRCEGNIVNIEEAVEVTENSTDAIKSEFREFFNRTQKSSQ